MAHQNDPAFELDDWFHTVKTATEHAYLPAPTPWQQSGFSGTPERWETLRRPVADCVDRSGSFLDIGCASGYLLETLPGWVRERGLELELHGLDISEGLVEVARRRLPRLAAHLWVANAFHWTPPRRFDFVRTELLYVPEAHEADYLRHLLSNYLEPGGALLVANYLEGAADPAKHIDPGSRATIGILERLEELGFSASDFRERVDPVKGRKTRVAIVRAR